jgi:signal transduction histidine kinase
MTIDIAYRKPQVLQALRYHFISRPEIKFMMILVNVFALLAAVLLYLKKIGPLPFLLSSVLWISLMGSFWLWLPWLIYRRSRTFQDKFQVTLEEGHFHIDAQSGRKSWAWREFRNYFETPGFFHLYFDPRSFFLLPKTGFRSAEDLARAREILNKNVRKGSY